MAELTLQNFLDRIRPELNGLSMEYVEGAVRDDQSLQWIPQTFRVTPTDRLRQEYSIQERGREWPEAGELDPYPTRELDKPVDLLFSLREWKDSFTVSDLWLMGGQYSDLHMYMRFREQVEELLAGGLRAYARRAGTIWLGLWTGALQQCLDGENFFSANHVHGTGTVVYSNLLDEPLSLAALQHALELPCAVDMVDQWNNPIFLRFDTLYHGPALSITADTIINNVVLPGGTNSERNIVGSRISRRVEIPWMVDSQFPGASHWWAVGASTQHSLLGKVFQQPHLRPILDSGQDQVQVRGRALFEFYFKTWEGLIGSTGGAGSV